jgi:hypothetical protein
VAQLVPADRPAGVRSVRARSQTEQENTYISLSGLIICRPPGKFHSAKMTTKYTAICAALCVSASPHLPALGWTHNIEYDRLDTYVLSKSGREEEEGGQDGPGHTSAGTASAPPSASTSGSAATGTWQGRIAASVGAQNVVVVVCVQ